MKPPKRPRKGAKPWQPTKCRKRRIHPTPRQAEKLKLWLDGARFAYNLAVEHVNRTKEYNKKSLREGTGVNTGVKKEKDGEGKWHVIGRAEQSPWERRAPKRLWDVPAKIRDAAVLDAHYACAALEEKEGSVKRTLKFRTSKDASQSFRIESKMINCDTKRAVCADLFGTVGRRTCRCGKWQKRKTKKHCACGCMRTEDRERLPAVFESDVRVVFEKCIGAWYLCAATEIYKPPSETQGGGEEDREANIAAIDPGVRTFATVYDVGRERVVEWGTSGGRNDGCSKGTELLIWLARKVNRLESAATRVHGRHRYRVRKLAGRIRKRIADLTNELHRIFARWLCENYSVVLLPRFSPKQLSRKHGLPPGTHRKLAKRSVRMLAFMAPFRFRQYLQHKARESGTRVVICSEAYTSKTCTRCGLLNRKLGANKTFACQKCGVVYDRDHGAARNVLLRYLKTQDLIPPPNDDVIIE
jgi:transposase